MLTIIEYLSQKTPKFNRLRAIHIQYLSYQSFKNKYSFDGFALFEFISYNAQLQQVTIKGVQIKKMHQFIQSLSKNTLTRQRIKNNKHLKLAINFQYELHGWNPNASNISYPVSRLQNLCYFRQQFQELSQITVIIIHEGRDWGNSLKRLLLCLKTIRKIKITIRSMNYSLLKQLLCELALLTEITSLQFHLIKKGQNNKRVVSAKDQSSMEVSLTELFTTNTITRLALYDCQKFPSLPKINTLQSIHFDCISFKGDFQLSQFIRNNTKLQRFAISWMQRCDLTIEEQLFNQLQYLSIQCPNILSFAHILPLSPSKLKQLNIDLWIYVLCNQYFPSQQISFIYFEYQHLSAIPSEHLDTLYIWGNNTITDKCLQLIDSKWPYLKRITLGQCPLITERIFSLCRFKGLLRISADLQKTSILVRKHLMKRGIQLLKY